MLNNYRVNAIFLFSGSRYVHNNIFFSFAVDADLERLSKNHMSDSISKTGSTGSLHSSSEKSPGSLLHRESEIPNGEKCVGSCAGECHDALESTPDVSAETQLGETEQATYASANNDLKGTKAYQEADVSGLYNLAMAIIDYRGHRVVAQVCCESDVFHYFFYFHYIFYSLFSLAELCS